ncbi:MAG: efflux RND transporter periplasmic adaptor subunit [Candidatus Binatia bacterium]
MQEDPKNYTPRKPGKRFVIGWLSVVLVVFVVTAALVRARDIRMQRSTAELEEQLAQGAHVLVTHVRHAPPHRTLALPATIHGFIETPMYAKVAGYLKTIDVDKGDRVKKGQVLAVLESPELDQQVANARANYDFQVLTNQRNQELVQKALIAQQDADQSRAAMLQAKATLDQLLAQQAYEAIRAPFDGIVTARTVDPGALIPQVTTPAASTPIVTLATLSPVRVYTDVPQSAAPLIQNGDAVNITVTEYPGRAFKGNVTRHPDALQAATRTMLVEVDIPNHDLALLPGMYAEVTFNVAVPAGPPLVPDDSLIFQRGKVYVPLVRENRLHLAPVTLGYDDGRSVEVTEGVDSDDVVAINLGQSVHDGEVVQPVPVADQ